MYQEAPSWGSLVRRLLTCFVVLLVVFVTFLWAIPQVAGYLVKHDEKFALAAESTAWLLDHPVFSPEHVFVSQSLAAQADEEGLAIDDLQAIIAAAASETQHETHEQWLKDTYSFSAVLMGLAKVESSYCRNIGGGIAYDEVTLRLERSEEEESGDVGWWRAQLTALEQIASELHEDVHSIPGSVGAGAISCFQLMPSNWLRFGGGDYRRTFQAALNAARYLNTHGYPDDVDGAILSYNFNAGQPYVDDVLAGTTLWEQPVKTAFLAEPQKPGKLVTLMVYLEFLAWHTGNYALVDIGPVGDFVHPYPGSHPVSYFWKQEVWGWSEILQKIILLILHPGQDYGGISGGPIVAAHPGRVTFARYLCPNRADPLCENPNDSAQAAKWWISGVVVVIRGEFPDGSPVCTGYGHGALGSLQVSDGDVVEAGQHIMDAGSTGFSTGVHLHFFVSDCGDTYWDPNQYVK